jgi:hypothetical protein
MRQVYGSLERHEHSSTVDVHPRNSFGRAEVSMLQRGAWIVLGTLVLILSTPRDGRAGIGELIWEMSGPQMVGGGVQCKFDFNGNLDICYVSFPVPGPVAKVAHERRFRVSMDGGVYVSTGKNAGGVDYEAWKTWMLAFDPMIELVTSDNQQPGGARREWYHGIMGVSYNFLVGSDFKRFSNVGLKLRPIGYRRGRVNFEFDLRIYPSGFTASQFGKESTTPEPNRAEVTYGFSMGIAFAPRGIFVPSLDV